MNIWYWLLIAAGLAALLLGACAKAFSGNGSGIDYRRGGTGKTILLDTPGQRADAAMAYDANIAMERRGHRLSDGGTWNDRWLRIIKSVRRNSENPEWYVQYIVTKRREAGLPELVGLDDDPP
ncbi:hypothetical protein [[Pseudomonas] boreopolis]|uniref:hypothetical protein n=1 Tax=Xanthomonas boreopolis TaxID=86183 RepID=UPI003DA06940